MKAIHFISYQWLRIIFLLAGFFFTTLSGNFGLRAQPFKERDSLLRLVKHQKNDTEKVKSLCYLSDNLLRLAAFDSSLQVAGEALALAEKTGFLKGKANANSMIARNNYYLGDYRKARLYYNRALEINRQAGSALGIGYSYNNIALLYTNQGQFDSAIYFLKMALRYFLKENYKRGITDCRSNIGVANFNLGNYSIALTELYSALRMAEAEHNSVQALTAMNHIAAIQVQTNNYKDAEKNYLKMLEVAKEIGSKRSIAEAFGNLGILYNATGKFRQAEERILASIEIVKQIGYKRGEAACLTNLGNVYLNLSEYDKAVNAHFSALAIMNELRDSNAIAATLINIGEIYSTGKKYTAAKKYFQEANKIAMNIKAGEMIKTSFLALSVMDSVNRDYKSALGNFKNYVLYRDSLLNEENTKKMVQQQMQYEFDKKSAADSIRNAEEKRIEEINHQSQIRSQKLYTYTGLAGFLIMIVIAGISFVAFRNKKKANVEIQRQKHLVEEKQKEILDSIYYARRIQRALITSEFYIEKKLSSLRRKE